MKSQHIHVQDLQLLQTEGNGRQGVWMREKEGGRMNEPLPRKEHETETRIICFLKRNQCSNAFCTMSIVFHQVWLSGLKMCIFHTMHPLNANIPLPLVLGRSHGDPFQHWMVQELSRGKIWLYLIFNYLLTVEPKVSVRYKFTEFGFIYENYSIAMTR